MTYPEGIQWDDEVVTLVIGIAAKDGGDHIDVLGQCESDLVGFSHCRADESGDEYLFPGKNISKYHTAYWKSPGDGIAGECLL